MDFYFYFYFRKVYDVSLFSYFLSLKKIMLSEECPQEVKQGADKHDLIIINPNF